MLKVARSYLAVPAAIGLLMVWPVSAQPFYTSCYDGNGNIFNATLLLPEESLSAFADQSLSPGSEVAVFTFGEDRQNECIGKTVWSGKTGYITIWADDYVTSSLEGLRENEAFELHVYDSLTGIEFRAADLTAVFLDGSPRFKIDAIYTLSSISTSFDFSAPRARDDEADVLEDDFVIIDVLANDFPGESGTVVVTGVFTLQGLAEVMADKRSIRYTPEKDFFGVARLSYNIQDALGVISNASVTVNVQPVDDPPVFVSEAVVQSSEGDQYLYRIITADVDGDTLMVNATQLPDWISLRAISDSESELKGFPITSDVGEHLVTLVLDDGTSTVEQEFTLSVRVAENPPLRPTLSDPAFGSVEIPLNHRFSWERTPGGVITRFQITNYEDYTFSNTIIDEVTFQLWYDVTQLNPLTKHMWRIRAENSAGLSQWSPINFFTTVSASAVDVEDETDVPFTLRLDQNYPNPFNPITSIEFGLPSASHVRIEVFDMLGRPRAVLIDGYRNAGRHRAVWDASAESSGIYIYRLTVGDKVLTRTLSLLK